MEEKRILFERILGLDDSWNASTYSSVNKWIKAVRRRGDRRSTKLAYFKWLSMFLRSINLSLEEDKKLVSNHTPSELKEEMIHKITNGLNPDRLIELSPKDIAEKIQVFCDEYNENEKARTAHLALNYLRSFFKHNDIELDLEDYHWRKNKRFEYVPTKEEVYKISDHCDARGRAIILCTFQSGMRNSTLRALNYGDIREPLEAGKVPIRVHVNPILKKRIPEACKEDVEYFTFFGKEATEALKEYVNWRAGKYGEIRDEEPLFLPYDDFNSKTEPRTNSPISEDSLERMIKRAARRARIGNWRFIRFHTLRKCFRAILDAGYVDGGQMAEDDKEYLMGHRLSGAKEPYHNANVNVLEERYYRLRWGVESVINEATKIEAIKTFARTLGINELEIRIAKLKKTEKDLSDEEAIGRIIRGELGIDRLKTESSKRKNGDPKKIIGENKLERYLAEGWDVQTVLPSGKILIRRDY